MRAWGSIAMVGVAIGLAGCSPGGGPTALPIVSDRMTSMVVADQAMEPTFPAGARVTVNLGVTVRPGQVALVNIPGKGPRIRRVIAVAGDWVMIDGSKSPPWLLLRSGAENDYFVQQETYIEPVWTSGTFCCDSRGRANGPAHDVTPFRVPPGEVFVLNDNRQDLGDSRTVGAIPLASVRGRVLQDPRLPLGGYALEPWTRNGKVVDPNVVVAYGGPAHCGLQAITFLALVWPLGSKPVPGGPQRIYVREAGEHFNFVQVVGTLALNAQLPPGARDTGFQASGVHLYLDGRDQDQYAYLVGLGRVERWPREEPVRYCM